jgi:parallel beta-helix repeat protein
LVYTIFSLCLCVFVVRYFRAVSFKPPEDGMQIPKLISSDIVLEPGVYDLPDGLTIAAGGVTLDGNGAMLVGRNRQNSGVTVRNQSGVTIKNLRIRDYYHGIDARECPGLTITGCQLTSTAEVPANTIFLDIRLPLEQAYGGGILLANSPDARILENDLQHQMVGMLSYANLRLEVRNNNASYCSGWGFHLYETSDSRYENNCADYCCRWEPRGDRRGHMGADAAGFLIVYNSSGNIFRRNLARLGGDGFSWAAWPQIWCPCPAAATALRKTTRPGAPILPLKLPSARVMFTSIITPTSAITVSG